MMLHQKRLIGLAVASLVVAVVLVSEKPASADDVRVTVAPAIQRTDVSASSGTQVQQVCFGCRNRAAYRGWSAGGCYGCGSAYYSGPYYSGAYYPAGGYYQPYSGAYYPAGGYYQPSYGAYYGGYAGIAYGSNAPNYGYGYPSNGYGYSAYDYSNSYSNYGVGVPAYGNAYASSYPESRYPAYGYGPVSTAYGGLGVQDW